MLPSITASGNGQVEYLVVLLHLCCSFPSVSRGGLCRLLWQLLMSLWPAPRCLKMDYKGELLKLGVGPRIAWVMVSWCAVVDEYNLFIRIKIKLCLGQEVCKRLSIHPSYYRRVKNKASSWRNGECDSPISSSLPTDLPVCSFSSYRSALASSCPYVVTTFIDENCVAYDSLAHEPGGVVMKFLYHIWAVPFCRLTSSNFKTK